MGEAFHSSDTISNDGDMEAVGGDRVGSIVAEIADVRARHVDEHSGLLNEIEDSFVHYIMISDDLVS